MTNDGKVKMISEEQANAQLQEVVKKANQQLPDNKVFETTEKWGIFACIVRILCFEGKFEGTIRNGKLYMAPENALKPLDGRRSKNNLIMEVDYKKKNSLPCASLCSRHY